MDLEGLLIILKKRRLRASNSGYEKDSFLIWGYYDVLEIKPVKEWKGFSPEIIKSSPKIDLFSNETPIKLIKPKNASDLEAKNKKHICYAHSDINNGAFSDKPLLPLVLLHYTKNATKTRGIQGMVEYLTDRILAFYQEQLDEHGFDEANIPVWAVYPTIGFMDAALVCRSNNFATVSELVYWLRAEEQLLDSSYMLPCMLADTKKTNGGGASSDAINAWAECDYDMKTRLSIRTTLMPGVSTGNFIKTFSKELEGKEAAESDIYYEMFGNSDVLVLPDAPASKIAQLYTENGSLMFPPYADMLTSTRSSIRVNTPDGSHYSEYTHPKREIRPNEKDAIKQIMAIQTDAGSVLQKRHKWGLLNMAGFYYDITVSSHTFDIRSLMDPVLEALLRNIELAKNPDALEGFSADKFFTSFSVLRDTFTDLMNDFARADRHMFEGRWLKHPSVASAVKLVMAYHTFLMKVVNVFQHTGTSAKSSYAFLTASGGVDRVTADRLFNYYVNTPDEEHPIVILRLPEADLFRISRTLFHVVHEIFHVIGDRKRDERNKSILKSLAGYVFYRLLADLKTNKEFNEDWQRALTDGVVNAGRMRTLTDTYNKITEVMHKKYINEFRDVCADKWEDEIKALKPESPRSRHWEKKARKAVKDDFWATFYPKNLIENEKRDGEAYRIIIKTLDKILYFTPYLSTQLRLGRKLDVGITPEDIRRLIPQVFNETTSFKNHRRDSINTLTGHMYDMLSNSPDDNDVTFEDMFSYLVELYREAYADTAAIALLDCRVNQYLAAFYPLGHCGTYNDNLVDVLRVDSVIKVCFSDASDDIYEDFKKLSNDKHRVDALDNLIKTKNKFEGMFDLVEEPLINFLKTCYDSVKRTVKNHPKELGRLLSVYRNSLPSQVDAMPQLSYDALMEILKEWSEISTK